MAESIKFDYERMTASVANIQKIAENYGTAANTFKSSFETSISGWSGDSKDKMANFVNETVMNYLNSIQNSVNGLATLLQSNITSMQGADKELADNIDKAIASVG